MRTSNPLPKVRVSKSCSSFELWFLIVHRPLEVHALSSLKAECLSELEFTRRSVPIGEALASVLDLFVSEFRDPSAIVLESCDHLRECLGPSGMIMLALSLDIPSWARVRICANLADQSLSSHQHYLQGDGHKLRQEITRHPHPEYSWDSSRFPRKNYPSGILWTVVMQEKEIAKIKRSRQKVHRKAAPLRRPERFVITV